MLASAGGCSEPQQATLSVIAGTASQQSQQTHIYPHICTLQLPLTDINTHTLSVMGKTDPVFCLR